MNAKLIRFLKLNTGSVLKKSSLRRLSLLYEAEVPCDEGSSKIHGCRSVPDQLGDFYIRETCPDLLSFEAPPKLSLTGVGQAMKEGPSLLQVAIEE